MERWKEEGKKQTGRSYKMQNIRVRKEKGIDKVQKQRVLELGELKSMILASSLHRHGPHAQKG